MKKLVFYFDNSVNKIFTEGVDEKGEKILVISSGKNFVARAEVVAEVIEVNDENDDIKSKLRPGTDYYNVTDFKQVKADLGIYFDSEARAYKASFYGFVVYANGVIRILQCITYTKDKLKAKFLVHPTKSGYIPSYTEIEEEMKQNKIRAGIGEKTITEQLEKIDRKEYKLTKMLIARGKESVNGHAEYFIPLLSTKKKAGEIKSDGSMDFKEVGSIIQVSKNQEVLKRIPAVKSVNGFDVFGDKIVAGIEEVEGYRRGDNIVQSGHDENIYCSSIDGSLIIDNKLISVLPVAYINGDVNYDTGNIDFKGSVHIRGSVLAGFTVRATGDITVEKTVEDSIILADGDITVKMGVVGKDMVKLIAGGSLNSKYLLNARVEAAGEIIVQDSIINCNVFSNDRISVVAKSGKIIGGETIALHEIIVKVAGAPNETETILRVGRNLFIEREVKELRKDIDRIRESVNEVVRLLKTNFGEGVFEDPKKYLAILPAIKKKKCLELLKELSAGNKSLKDLIDKSAEVQKGIQLKSDPVIIVLDKIYPGTVLNIKKSIRKIDSVNANVKFYEDPEEKAIRFVPAV